MDGEVPAYHIPVLPDKATSLLISNPDGVYVDGTLGGGGHSARILKGLSAHGRLFGFDQDAEAVAEAAALFAQDSRMVIEHSNVVYLVPVLTKHNITGIDGILLDLGVSSHQIDAPERGFSFRYDGPLDMRMDSGYPNTAAELIRTMDAQELAELFWKYGEERRSRRIAEAIVSARRNGAVGTTGQLAEIIRGAVPALHVNKTLARIFQALRIAVNRELDILEETLSAAFDFLVPGGRLVVISYHSLEDRIVKNFIREEARYCVCPPRTPVCVCGKVQRARILTSKPVEADENEVRRNPRARSARLRAGEKIHS